MILERSDDKKGDGETKVWSRVGKADARALRLDGRRLQAWGLAAEAAYGSAMRTRATTVRFLAAGLELSSEQL